MGSLLRKQPHMYDCFSYDGASFGLIDPQEHKSRRDLITPLFQPKAILQLHHVLQAKVRRYPQSQPRRAYH